MGRGRTNCLDCGSRWDGQSTSPVRSFAPNDFGLYDPVGNVAQWVAPDSAPRVAAVVRCPGQPNHAAIFGASWADPSKFLVVNEVTCFPKILRDDTIGFRVATTIYPL